MYLNHKFFAIHVLTPVFVGGMIYLCWRSQILLMFRWVDAVGLQDTLLIVRDTTLSFKNRLPEILFYSFPNALWIYSLTAFMVYYWYDSRSVHKYFWFGTGPFLGAGVEAGQFFRFIPGTYDVVDLGTALFASLLPFCLIKLEKRVRK